MNSNTNTDATRILDHQQCMAMHLVSMQSEMDALVSGSKNVVVSISQSNIQYEVDPTTVRPSTALYNNVQVEGKFSYTPDPSSQLTHAQICEDLHKCKDMLARIGCSIDVTAIKAHALNECQIISANVG